MAALTFSSRSAMLDLEEKVESPRVWVWIRRRNFLVWPRNVLIWSLGRIRTASN